MRAHEKIKEVYNAAAVGFDDPLTVTFGNERWPQFKEAMHVRHDITHPKEYPRIRSTYCTVSV